MTEFAAQETNINKTGWPRGPWDNEPDKAQWVDESTGLDCLIVRNNGGALCGYVGIPSTHPMHGANYGAEIVSQKNGEYIEVHGGLTYSNSCAGSICHDPKVGANDDVWWFGFDCAHAGDLCPKYLSYADPQWKEEYRDIDYIKRECSSLARQLAEATEIPS